MAYRVGRECCVERAENVLGRLEERNFHIFDEVGERFPQILDEKIMHLGRELHSGGAAPHDDKMDQSQSLLLGDPRNARAFEAIDDALPDPAGVRKLLEHQRMFGYAGDPVRIYARAGRNDQFIIPEHERGAVERPAAPNRPFPGIDRCARGLIVSDHASGCSDWLDDASELDRADRRTGKERGEEEVIPGTNDNDVVQPGVELFYKAERRKP